MYELVASQTFDAWIRKLRDREAKARIQSRIRRLSLGNPGQMRALKNAICEMKIDYGPGYRVYYTFKGSTLVLLLCGGGKSTQTEDIKLATRILADWEK